jgi:nicotinate-nucleotide adenylyltransferase
LTRIGLFGGSFDPPHLAHLALARLALDHLKLDRLLWLPAGNPWQKAGRTLAPAADRVAMIRLLIEGEPRFALDERELQRAGPSYTIDTVQELRAELPTDAELFLVIGQDQFLRLPTWHRWPELAPLVGLAVAGRSGQGRAAPTLSIEAAAVSAEPAQAPHPAQRVHYLPLPDMPQASTAIRLQAARGEDCGALAGAAIARYIEIHHLYREGTAP